MSQDDDQLVERVAMIIAKHVFTERASEWPYAGKEEEIRGRLQRAARAALSAMPQRELLAEALEALTPFAAQSRASGPTEERNIRRARAAADKIRAALDKGEPKP